MRGALMSANLAPAKERTEPFGISMIWQEGKDFAQLIKMRLSLLVLLSVLAGYWLALRSGFSPALFLELAFGSFLLIGGANGFNEILETKQDALMKRTAVRPLPSGRMERKKAWVIASFLTLTGIFLLTQVNFLTAFLAVLAFSLYLFGYTPLKKRSSWCVLIGAVSGAIPALMGAVAVQNAVTSLGLLLFSLVFFWQFPHFFAIAYLAQEDYKRAGFKVLPFPENSRFTAYEILLGSLVLLGLSPLLALWNQAGLYYFWGAIFLSIFLLISAWFFFYYLTLPYARRVMGATLLYLPLLYAFMIFDKVPVPFLR